MTEFEQHCWDNRSRIRTLPINEQYQQTIEYRGTIYYYDPDYDCFYPRVDADQLTLWDRYGWIVVIAALTILAVVTA